MSNATHTAAANELVDVSPTSGDVVGRYAMTSPDEVAAVVKRGRAAFASWAQRSVVERLAYLRRMQQILVDELDRAVHVVARSTGKPDLEALGGDVLSCAMTLDYLVRHAEEVLAAQSRPSPRLFGRSFFVVEYAPLGVVAIIAPWNYPLQLALLPLVTALAAGNTVVLKPSEITPSVGEYIAELCARAGLPPNVVQVVQGDKRVGEALVGAGPDKVFFTGSVATGKQVAAAAARALVPVELELGGKDPMIVFADAPFERAVNAAVYGAFANAGQACISIERAYVEQPIYERFVHAVTERAQKLRVGSGRHADIGPVILDRQRAIIDQHVRDAIAQGAKPTAPWQRDGTLYGPLVLKDADQRMTIMTEETFGPVLPVMPFRTEAEAIELANGTVYGLNASVWTGDLERGRRVVQALITGNAVINDVLVNVANPHVPFGGEKHSGMGRYHGPEGLRGMSRQRAVMVSRERRAQQKNWFPYRPSGYTALKSIITGLYRPGSVWSRAHAVAGTLLGAARERASTTPGGDTR